jgi:hypothetical protein
VRQPVEKELPPASRPKAALRRERSKRLQLAVTGWMLII